MVRHWSVWDEMEIKQINFYLQDPVTRFYRVIVTSNKQLYQKSWMTFMYSMSGFNPDTDKYNKNKTPLHKYMTSSNQEELAKNLIVKITPVEPIDNPIASHFADVVSFLKYPFTPMINLFEIANQFLGAHWYSDEVKKLGHHYFMLEAHRKFLVLEDQVLKSENQELIASLATSRLSALNRRYLVVDPITLIIPILVSLAVDDLRVMDKKARLTIAVEDLKDLVMIYNSLSSRMELLFPDTFVVDHIVLPIGISLSQPSDMAKIMYRKEKEERMITVFNNKHKSEWVNMYLRIIAKAPVLLANDQLSLANTKHLEGTPSLPASVYNIESFIHVLG